MSELLSHRGVRLLGALATWVFVLAVVGWVASMLLTPTGGGPFYGWQGGDAAGTQWYYDWVARSVLAGEPLDVVRDFDFPTGRMRAHNFPALGDALLVLPLHVLLDWPEQWQATQILVVAVSALGLAWLARGVGCRHLGVAYAGAIGALLHPIFFELHMGRTNSCWIGIAAAAVAGALEILRPGSRLWTRALWVPVVAVIGGLCSTYPPFLLMLMPLGIALVLRDGLRASQGQGLLVLLAVALAIAIAVPDLQSMNAFPRERTANVFEMCFRDGTMPLGDWWSWGGQHPAARPKLLISAGAWIIAPLALLHPSSRLPALVGLPLALLLALLGSGPCLELSSGAGLIEAGSSWAADSRELWAPLQVVHVPGRFALAGGVVAAVLGGLGLEALLLRARGRWRIVLGVVAALLGIGLVVVAGSMTVSELRNAGRWGRATETRAAGRIAEMDAGLAVAELPFAIDAQFPSVLRAPGPPRLAPLAGGGPPPESLAIAWLQDLGSGHPLGTAPTREEVREAGVGLVVFDSTHCSLPLVPESACSSATVEALEEVLGPPTEDPGGILVWDLGAG